MAAMLLLSDTEPMSRPEESNANPSQEPRSASTGRYRFVAGRAVDPAHVGPVDPIHPERESPMTARQAGVAVPDSPAQLIAMQNASPQPRPEKPERQPNPTVTRVLELLDTLQATPADDLELVVGLVRRLEGYHDSVVEDLRVDDSASHNKLIAWAIDADRLMRCRVLLESVDLE
jgi:hypothetical protein